MRAAAVALAIGLLACACGIEPLPKGGNRPSLTPTPARDDLGDRALAHTAKLCGFGARHVGSKGWRLALLYIESELRKLGLEPQRDTWTDPSEQLEFTNISVILAGERNDRIVIGCHHDTKCTTGHPRPEQNFHFVGANDSGSGVGLLLALASELRDSPNRATIELVFFDGEESIPYDWTIERALFGSRRYVANYRAALLRGESTAPIRAFVLLDMVGAKDLQIDDETHSSRELNAIFARAAEACEHGEVFFANSLAVTDDHMPFLNAGIPSIDLIDIFDNPEWHTEHDTLETLSAASLQIVGDVVMTALPAIERRYVTDRPNLVLPPEERR